MKSKYINLNKGNVLIVLILLLTTFSLFASRKPDKVKIPAQSITVSIIVQDAMMLKDGFIEFMMYEDGINSNYSMRTNYFKQNIKDRETRFVVPLSTAINYGKIDYSYRNDAVKRIKKPIDPNCVFIFQSGDDIEIFIGKDYAVFSGKGNEKYNCLYQVSKNSYLTDFQNIKSTYFVSKGDYFSSKSYLIGCADSLYQVKRKIIEKCIKTVDRKIYSLLLADAWGSYNSEVIGIIFAGTLGVDNGVEFNSAVQQTYNNYLKNFKRNIFADSILAESFQYCDFLMWKERKSQGFLKKQNILPKSLFSYVINSILHNYDGIVKEKLILLAHYNGTSDYSDYSKFDTSLNINAPNSIYKAALNDYKDKLINDAFPFELPDENGKIHKLKDFKGKLVVMDFWFTGCQGCVGMATSLKPIIISLKSTPKIVFLSISIDGEKFKHLWVESLKNETYSSKNEINLLAVEGNRSEIIKYYNIIAYPKLVVLSEEGKIISTSPPDPRNDPLKFKLFLNEHLKLLK